jgi:hypothetical protein
VTAVFFLFLLHLSVGLLFALCLVPHRAGDRFFKLCAASAALMTTAALALLWRRYGSSAPDALFPRYSPLLGSTGLLLGLAVVLNRAWHFGWKRAYDALLWAAAFAGALALALAARSWGEMASDATSALLLGAAASAMVLGHYYLVVLDLPISALRRLTVLLVTAIGLRTVVVAAALFAARGVGLHEAGLVLSGLFSPDGIFVWMRLLFGIVGPLSLVYFIWRTVEIRSTQSATGILYVQLFLVLAGELLAKHLRVFSGLPL